MAVTVPTSAKTTIESSASVSELPRTDNGPVDSAASASVGMASKDRARVVSLFIGVLEDGAQPAEREMGRQSRAQFSNACSRRGEEADWLR